MAVEVASDAVEGFIGLLPKELERIAKIILYGLSVSGHHYQLIDPYAYFQKTDEKRLTKRQIMNRHQNKANSINGFHTRENQTSTDLKVNKTVNAH